MKPLLKLLSSLLTLPILAAGGLVVGKTYAPCSAPMRAIAKIGMPLDATCPPEVAVVEAPKPKPETVSAPAVTVAEVARRHFVDRLFVSGTLVAREEALVAAQVDGLTIVEVLAEDGDRVKAGQLLARLDRSQLDAMLAQNDATTQRADAAIQQANALIEQATAQVTQSTDDYNRGVKLGLQVMAAATIEQRQTALKTAHAQLRSAQYALSVLKADRLSRDAERRELLVRIARTDVKAPVQGIVSRRTAKLGASVAGNGDPLFRIIKNGDIDLEADVPEQSVARLAVGMPAALEIPGSEKQLSAKVRLISQEIDKAGRTGKVRFALDLGSDARIGGFASGVATVAENDGVGVPQGAVLHEGEIVKTLVVKDDVVEARKVTLGISEGEWVEVTSGLQPGERVVARAAAFLRPGDRVRPVVTTAMNP